MIDHLFLEMHYILEPTDKPISNDNIYIYPFNIKTIV